MIATNIDPEDIQTLAEILENEKRLHARKCQLCFALFAMALVVLVGAMVVVGFKLAAVLGESGLEEIAQQVVLVQVLGPLAGAVLLFFSGWWAAQNCVNTIERTLCAARNQRVKLFETFLSQIQCADKQKREAWLEIVKGVVM